MQATDYRKQLPTTYYRIAKINGVNVQYLVGNYSCLKTTELVYISSN